MLVNIIIINMTREYEPTGEYKSLVRNNLHTVHVWNIICITDTVLSEDFDEKNVTFRSKNDHRKFRKFKRRELPAVIK